ncbi:hypothetical protein M5689_019009 [Euphorbia peplus]|nr:hypothetical protein M5689_019009 [Euphorbia peplus]
MILRQMKSVKPNGTLAYGSLLTRIFESVGVEIPTDVIRSRSTPIAYGPLTKLSFGQLRAKKTVTSAPLVRKEVHKNVAKDTRKGTKKGKADKGKKKTSSTVVMTVEKMAADAPISNLVQTRINVEPSGKVVAAKPSEAAEKTSQEMEDDRLADRVAEAEKLKAVLQQVEKNRRAEAVVAAHNELDEAEAAVREEVAKAKANFDAQIASEDAEEDVPFSRKRTYRIKASAAMRRPMRKRHFEMPYAHELEDDIPEEKDNQEDVNDGEDVHMNDDEENFNDDGAPIIKNLFYESSPEHENQETVLEGA